MSTKEYSSKQEKIIANYLGWQVVPGSGARACHPGDIVSDDWLGECKTHLGPDHMIEFKYDVWLKLLNEADSQFKYPILIVDDGSQKIEHTWCVILNHSVSDVSFKILPFTINKNIRFDGSTLKYKLQNADVDTFQADWQTKCICICPISNFKDILMR